MSNRRPAGSRLAAALWLVAALLAWTATAIRHFRAEGIDWRIAAAGLFCAAMGVGAWARSRRSEPSPR